MPSSINQLYNVTPSFGPGASSYHENQVLTSAHSPVSSRSPTFHDEKSSSHPSNLRSVSEESTGLLHSQTGSNIKRRSESLLDLVKNNKTKSLELSDVFGHVIEFSMDQHRSRFIQQKLETATVNEKIKIFSEIIPHARNLMIDVFGNYVIQKFFEHGTDSQRKELARHLIGHVLPHSLQMYGCRVIQKALEVVDVELQTEMVKELDGSVLKCVRDQNGNHVIQKCIECIPQDRIQSIISSLLGQVVNLSTHAYGCRVIQELKLGFLTNYHASVAAKNLKLLMNGRNKTKLSTYSHAQPAAIVSLGRREGIMQIYGFTLSGCIPGMMKSGDLFVTKSHKERGLKS